jgi:hypothetical protein
MAQFVQLLHAVQRDIGELQAALLARNMLVTSGKIQCIREKQSGLSDSQIVVLLTHSDTEPRATDLEKECDSLNSNLLALSRSAESLLLNACAQDGAARAAVLSANFPSLFQAANGIQILVFGRPSIDFLAKIGPLLRDFLANIT